MWIIDLLLEKLRKKKENFEPDPLYIEDVYPEWPKDDKEEEKSEENKVIIIDL